MIYQSLIFVMTSNNVDKDMKLPAQTTNQKLKQNAQTQDANGMQAMSEL